MYFKCKINIHKWQLFVNRFNVNRREDWSEETSSKKRLDDFQKIVDLPKI